MLSRLVLMVVTVCVMTGCAINDPTENTGGVTFVNDTHRVLTVAYCADAWCDSTYFTYALAAGGSGKDSITAGHGNLAVMVVTGGGGPRACIRIAKWPTASIRLSMASPTSCHRPYASPPQSWIG